MTVLHGHGAETEVQKLRHKLSTVAFARNKKGNMALMFALVSPVLMASVGVAVDFAFYSMKLSRLQGAADRAAIAAVSELAVVNADSKSVTQVAENFARTGLSNASLAVGVKVGEKRDQVTVKLTEEWTPFFANFLGAKVTPVVVDATAKLAGSTNICVLALNPSGAKAIHMDKRAKLNANGCAVYSNSSHNQSIRLDQVSEMKAALICAVGGVQAKTNAISPAATTDCTVLPDPLASRNAPVIGACKSVNFKVSTGSHVLDPGTYCGGIDISGTANVAFTPGNYVIKDGPFKISNKSTVKSENAAFYLTGAASTIQFTGTTTIDMTGATTGEMAGLLFFEERSAVLGRTHRINSSNARNLTGTIYISRGRLRIDPNSMVAGNSAYTAIIANELEVDEGPTLVLNSNYGATDVPVPDGIAASSNVVLTE
jgi:Flp pilus assembly protein TadG